MSNHNKKTKIMPFKLDSAENIGKKLLHGRDPSTYHGGSGGLGLIGGAARGLVKMAGGFANTAKQYLGGGAFSNTAKQYLRGGKAARPNAIPDRGLRLNPSKTPISPQKPGQIPKTGNFRPLITGNKVYNKKMIDDAFAKRFGPPNVKK